MNGVDARSSQTPNGRDPEKVVSLIKRGGREVPSLREGIGLTVVFALIGASGRVVVPIVIQQAIDKGMRRSGSLSIPDVDLNLIFRLCLIGAFSLLVATVFQRTAVLRLGRRSEAALYDLRIKLFRHIHNLSIEDHNEERRGALVARVTSDVETLTQFFSWGGLAFLLNGALMITVAGVMLAYDWVLASVVLAVSAPLVFVLRKVQSKLVAAYDSTRSANAEVLGITAELVTGAETLHAYEAGASFGRRAKDAARHRGDTQSKASMIGALLFPSGEMFGAVAVSGVVFFGLMRGPESGLTSGALVGFIFLTYRFLEPIAELTEVLDQTQTAVSGLRRILGILDIPVGPPAAESPSPLGTTPLDIEIDRVSFAYRSRPEESAEEDVSVLTDIDCRIPFGRRVAIVGSTGSGKTTLGRLIGRFTDPDRGDIRLGGVSLRQLANEELRTVLMVVPQEPFLFSDTIAANLRFAAPNATNEELLKAFVDLELGDWFDTLPGGLDTLVGQRGAQLSAGERQLIALVRAALVDPAILVLDEATSSVDASTEVRLTKALERLSSGRTTISIAHRLSTAIRADQILVLESGRLIQQGRHEDLVKVPGIYLEMFRSWETSQNNTDQQPRMPQ